MLITALRVLLMVHRCTVDCGYELISSESHSVDLLTPTAKYVRGFVLSYWNESTETYKRPADCIILVHNVPFLFLWGGEGAL